MVGELRPTRLNMDLKKGKILYTKKKKLNKDICFMVNTRQVLLFPGEDGYVIAECPSLPGCVSQGKTTEEAVENIREAIPALY